MRCIDSRRLTGQSLLLRGPGAVLEVQLTPDEAVHAILCWEKHARRLLAAVGWQDEALASRRHRNGASLAISAPADALYAATEVNEAAWAAATAELGTPDAPAATPETLRQRIAAERQPAFMALRRTAAARDVTFLWDDETVSVGLGRGCRSWPAAALPPPADVDWGAVHDVPVALITGTNGKTTTVRMLAAIAAGAGVAAGNTSTDGVQIGGLTVLAGDYTGPEGARALLRDDRIDMALLEVARGGLLRRGLPLGRAATACVTNVGHDHLGESGIDDIDALVQVKLLVAAALRDGPLVVNADDVALATAARRLPVRRAWIGLQEAAMSSGEPSWTAVDGSLVCRDAGVTTVLLPESDVAATFGGVARHNTCNALCAAALATALGFDVPAIVGGLRAFRPDLRSHPGRGNLLDLGGLRVWFDFAHNPEGLETVMAMAARMPARRRLVILGQAGDRDDASIDALGRIAARHRPDRVLLKQMSAHLRGRAEGEVVARLRAALLDAGYPESAIEICPTEMAAMRSALAWGCADDLLLLLSHAERSATAALLARLRDIAWQPGEPLPDDLEG